MKKRTISNALALLDAQRAHAERLKTPEQQAYYDGMRAMLEICLSEAYTNDRAVIYSETGHLAMMGAERGVI